MLLQIAVERIRHVAIGHCYGSREKGENNKTHAHTEGFNLKPLT